MNDDCNHFKMRCFVVAGFVLTSTPHSPSAIAELLVIMWMFYTVSQKNDSDVAHYNFSAHQPILVIFCRDIAE